MFALMVCWMIHDGACKAWAHVEGMWFASREKCEAAKVTLEADKTKPLVLECRERSEKHADEKSASDN